MNITKYDFLEGAKQATGITVIIDVFRAFSVACYCVASGAKKVIPMATPDAALAFADASSRVVRIGERSGKKLPGFDFGNSPTELEPADLDNAIVIQTTHAGTQGLVNANNATEVLTGALVNARATASYIKQQQPQVVSLVRMGWEASEATDEDDLCADYLESLLLGKPFDETRIRETLLASPCAERFLDPNQPWNPIGDFDHCTDVNRFDFALKLVNNSKGPAYLTRVNVTSC